MRTGTPPFAKRYSQVVPLAFSRNCPSHIRSPAMVMNDEAETGQSSSSFTVDISGFASSLLRTR
ncbi:hypothetical protein GKE82_13490 [Conexibacter sp. W3-3-2]|uniref:hypothetical protein n=1 Tax=Conexibacter sp. W3-3-2 TaxID=2675227 RepID=UPI0012B8E4A5|nr:hypothetical protein [Conexibacter sp. W3-3-2]MTD45272.1 hypothetical protein [Conexibacter sp. W3-3-2]